MYELKNIHDALLPDWDVTINVSGDKPISKAQHGHASMGTLASSMEPGSQASC